MIKRDDRDSTTLDGLTVLRFTQATEAVGGVEQYLKDLNRALLQKNRMNIVQLYLPLVSLGNNIVCEEIGQGVLIKVPMIPYKPEKQHDKDIRIKRFIISLGIKNMIRDAIIYNPIFKGILQKFIIKKSYTRYDREPLDVIEKLNHIFEHYNVNLIVIHLAGGWGSSEVIREAESRKIPYVILNHFSNSWYKRVGFREQVAGAAGIGGVSGKDVPKYIKVVYKNLSDGIDTDFFNKDSIKRPPLKGDIPIVMLPSRVVPGKGHRDIIKVAHLLKRKDFHFRIVFAGRTNNGEFTLELQKFIRKYELTNRINFVGELNQEELREWYAASSVVVLPSRNEGLGRVLLEAQAMGLPVIAYNVGGISEAVLDGISGHLVRKGSITNLASRIFELLNDDQKRVSMGKAGRKFVESKFSHSALAKSHEEWYLSALESAK